jgi:hypothetical protein
MSVKIYDSKGREYGADDEQGRANERISEFFFAGVRVAVDLTSTPEVVAFFRANESDHGRAEQFYAVYRAEAPQSLFATFVDELDEEAERVGLSIDTTPADMGVFELLRSTRSADLDDVEDARVVRHLLDGGRRVRFGVSSEERAVSLLKGFLGTNTARRGAIGDEAEADALSSYDVVFEPGSYGDLTPVGETEDHVEDAREEMKARLVDEKVNEVKSAVRTLREETDATDDEIRNRLRREVAVLSQAGTSSGGVASGGAGGAQGFGDDDGGRLSDRAKKAIVAVVVAALVLVVAAVVASRLGYVSLPLPL